VTGYGGGSAYDGLRFFPQGPTNCSVVGSHGAAWNTVYSESKGGGVNVVVNLRGFDEAVHGVYGSGAMEHLVSSFIGDGVVWDGGWYSDGIADWVTDQKYFYGYGLGGKLRSALNITASSIIPTKPHMVSNLRLKGVIQAIVDVTDGGSVGPIILSGALDVITDNEQGDQTAFNYIRATGSGTKTLTAPVLIGRVNLLNKPTAPKTSIAVISLSNFTLVTGAYVRQPNGEVLCIIPDDGVFKMLVRRDGTTRFSIRKTSNAGSPAAFVNDALLRYANGTDSAPVPNSSNVDFATGTVPTGTTGVDGKLTVYFRPTDAENNLYIENRLGSSQGFYIECDALV
jgi:hypothetical protein